jgi:NDP-sugar pyrophosphorylase family protein
MNALILSAGYGTRLWPITQRIPKPMIPVTGKPVLEHLADHLDSFGIKTIIANLHYRAEKIMEHFGTRLLYTYEPELLGEKGTIETLAQNFPFIRDEYLVVMNGDTLTNVNINKMLMLSKGRSIRFMDKDVYAGTQILSPDYFLGDKSFVNYYDFDAFWLDIGTLEGLRKAEALYAKNFNSLS